MTTEQIKQAAKDYAKRSPYEGGIDSSKAFLAGSTLREPEIEELKNENEELKAKLFRTDMRNHIVPQPPDQGG